MLRLDGWLSHRAAAAGVSDECESGDGRLIYSLIYAGDHAPVPNFSSHLQALWMPW